MGRDEDRVHDRWAELRFSIVGPLLAAPPKRGELRAALEQLARTTWRHPITGEPARFGLSTLERWYYAAQGAPRDPVGQLRRKLRKDAGQHPSLSLALREVLRDQYRAHRSWSMQLHADNLAVLVSENPSLGPMASATTIRRYMKAQGMVRGRRVRGPRRAARDRAARGARGPQLRGRVRSRALAA